MWDSKVCFQVLIEIVNAYCGIVPRSFNGFLNGGLFPAVAVVDNSMGYTQFTKQIHEAVDVVLAQRVEDENTSAACGYLALVEHVAKQGCFSWPLH